MNNITVNTQKVSQINDLIAEQFLNQALKLIERNQQLETEINLLNRKLDMLHAMIENVYTNDPEAIPKIYKRSDLSKRYYYEKSFSTLPENNIRIK